MSEHPDDTLRVPSRCFQEQPSKRLKLHDSSDELIHNATRASGDALPGGAGGTAGSPRPRPAPCPPHSPHACSGAHAGGERVSERESGKGSERGTR